MDDRPRPAWYTMYYESAGSVSSADENEYTLIRVSTYPLSVDDLAHMIRRAYVRAEQVVGIQVYDIGVSITLQDTYVVLCVDPKPGIDAYAAYFDSSVIPHLYDSLTTALRTELPADMFPLSYDGTAYGTAVEALSAALEQLSQD